MKRFLWHVLYYSGLNALLRLRARNTLTIVLYHGVDERRDLGTYNYRGKFITPEALDRQLGYLKKHYNVLPLDILIDALLHHKTLPPYPLAITFDDGYRNNFTHAFPLLRKHHLPATIFITTNFVEKQEPLWVDRLEYTVNKGTILTFHEEKIAFDRIMRERLKKLPHAERMRTLTALEEKSGARLNDFAGDRTVYAPLTWDDIAEMGHHAIMVGAHTASHPILSTLPVNEQCEEITNSVAVLRKHCATISSTFAYPNGQEGDVNDATREIVRDLGFTAALTTIPGQNKVDADPYLLARYTLDASESFPFFAATVSGTRHRIMSVVQLITSFITRYAKRS